MQLQAARRAAPPRRARPAAAAAAIRLDLGLKSRGGARNCFVGGSVDREFARASAAAGATADTGRRSESAAAGWGGAERTAASHQPAHLGAQLQRQLAYAFEAGRSGAQWHSSETALEAVCARFGKLPETVTLDEVTIPTYDEVRARRALVGCVPPGTTVVMVPAASGGTGGGAGGGAGGGTGGGAAGGTDGGAGGGISGGTGGRTGGRTRGGTGGGTGGAPGSGTVAIVLPGAERPLVLPGGECTVLRCYAAFVTITGNQVRARCAAPPQPED
jgi:hypothetical protein